MNVHCVIEDGDPGKEILRYAEEETANLIVMGSRGLSDLQGLLMGSVSHKVSHLSPCSCITVK
jgi:nucleotide-binding universal stress UspA family protein